MIPAQNVDLVQLAGVARNIVMRYTFSKADQLTIGTDDEDAEPVVRALGEGLAPLTLAKGEGGTGPAMRLDKSGHVKLSQSRDVGGGRSPKPEFASGHGNSLDVSSTPSIHMCSRCRSRRVSQ